MHTFKGCRPVRISILVSTISVRPLTRAEYFNATRSSQPVRRGRPVVDPYSSHGLAPVPRKRPPISSSNSVGKGPAPTREQNAFATPMTRLTCFGPTPRLVNAPPVIVDELVTY